MNDNLMLFSFNHFNFKDVVYKYMTKRILNEKRYG